MSTSQQPEEMYAVADCELRPSSPHLSLVAEPAPSLCLFLHSVCLIPMGVESPSVGPQIAECQRILEKSGLTFHMHGYGTNLEGPWSQVTKAIGDCHTAVHAMGTPRIATDIRIGTRTDKKIEQGQGNLGKVARVEEILGKSKA